MKTVKTTNSNEMVKQCAAMFCGKELDRNDEFYPFPRASPRQTFRLRIWRQRLLVARALPNQFACARHFSEEQFEARNGKLEVLVSFSPTRFTEDPIFRESQRVETGRSSGSKHRPENHRSGRPAGCRLSAVFGTYQKQLPSHSSGLASAGSAQCWGYRGSLWSCGKYSDSNLYSYKTLHCLHIYWECAIRTPGIFVTLCNRLHLLLCMGPIWEKKPMTYLWWSILIWIYYLIGFYQLYVKTLSCKLYLKMLVLDVEKLQNVYIP